MAVGEDRHAVDGEQRLEQAKAEASPPVLGGSWILIGGKPLPVAPNFSHRQEFGQPDGGVNLGNEACGQTTPWTQNCDCFNRKFPTIG